MYYMPMVLSENRVPPDTYSTFSYDHRQKIKRLAFLCDHIQGADNKLGQFLSQDIFAMADHRNCLRHSLESCSSLV